MASEDRPAQDGTPGRRWRILAHADTNIELANQGILDEVVIDDWLHLEQMSESEWCMRVGDARVWISVGETGRARVDVERGFYEEVTGETKSR